MPPCAPTRDHPRVRGEHAVNRSWKSAILGPSPRARGALGLRLRQGLRRGTIPACAGSTSSPPPTSRPRRDHPRVRGEHMACHRHGRTPAGPSPRARGALGGGEGIGPLQGTIPACAGSTHAWMVRGLSVWDHPRVRGEHPARIARMPHWLGPSPRARGAQFLTSSFMRAYPSFSLLLERPTYGTKLPFRPPILLSPSVPAAFGGFAPTLARRLW